MAPEKMRTDVNDAVSMLVCFSAARQRSELLAKAIIAAEVRIRTRTFKEQNLFQVNGRLSTTTHATEFGISWTRYKVIVDHAGCLHEGVADRRADKFESTS